jgi:hypothetical protein
MTNTTTEDNPTVGGDLTDAGDSDPDGTPLVVTTTPVSGPTNGTIRSTLTERMCTHQIQTFWYRCNHYKFVIQVHQKAKN